MEGKTSRQPQARKPARERDLTDALAVAALPGRKGVRWPVNAMYIGFLYGFLEFPISQNHRRSGSDVQL